MKETQITKKGKLSECGISVPSCVVVFEESSLLLRHRVRNPPFILRNSKMAWQHTTTTTYNTGYVAPAPVTTTYVQPMMAQPTTTTVYGPYGATTTYSAPTATYVAPTTTYMTPTTTYMAPTTTYMAPAPVTTTYVQPATYVAPTTTTTYINPGFY